MNLIIDIFYDVIHRPMHVKKYKLEINWLCKPKSFEKPHF